VEWFTDEQMAEFQKTLDEGKKAHAKKQKTERTKKSLENERRCKELGIKVVKGYFSE